MERWTRTPDMFCPWYITRHAVDRWCEITGARAGFELAREALLTYAARTWLRYKDTDRRAGVTRTGAYFYRGPGPLRLRLVVNPHRREEGPKGQVIDVLPPHDGWIPPTGTENPPRGNDHEKSTPDDDPGDGA